MTPLHIKLLIHSAISSETFEPWSGVAKEYLEQLADMGAVEPEGNNLTRYTATPLGKAWIQVLCNTPPPRIGFLDANGKEVLA